MGSLFDGLALSADLVLAFGNGAVDDLVIGALCIAGCCHFILADCRAGSMLVFCVEAAGEGQVLSRHGFGNGLVPTGEGVDGAAVLGLSGIGQGDGCAISEGQLLAVLCAIHHQRDGVLDRLSRQLEGGVLVDGDGGIHGHAGFIGNLVLVGFVSGVHQIQGMALHVVGAAVVQIDIAALIHNRHVECIAQAAGCEVHVVAIHVLQGDGNRPNALDGQILVVGHGLGDFGGPAVAVDILGLGNLGLGDGRAIGSGAGPAVLADGPGDGVGLGFPLCGVGCVLSGHGGGNSGIVAIFIQPAGEVVALAGEIDRHHGCAVIQLHGDGLLGAVGVLISGQEGQGEPLHIAAVADMGGLVIDMGLFHIVAQECFAAGAGAVVGKAVAVVHELHAVGAVVIRVLVHGLGVVMAGIVLTGVGLHALGAAGGRRGDLALIVIVGSGVDGCGGIGDLGGAVLIGIQLAAGFALPVLQDTGCGTGCGGAFHMGQRIALPDQLQRQVGLESETMVCLIGGGAVGQTGQGMSVLGEHYAVSTGRTDFCFHRCCNIVIDSEGIRPEVGYAAAVHGDLDVQIGVGMDHHIAGNTFNGKGVVFRAVVTIITANENNAEPHIIADLRSSVVQNDDRFLTVLHGEVGGAAIDGDDLNTVGAVGVVFGQADGVGVDFVDGIQDQDRVVAGIHIGIAQIIQAVDHFAALLGCPALEGVAFLFCHNLCIGEQVCGCFVIDQLSALDFSTVLIIVLNLRRLTLIPNLQHEVLGYSSTERPGNIKAGDCLIVVDLSAILGSVGLNLIGLFGVVALRVHHVDFHGVGHDFHIAADTGVGSCIVGVIMILVGHIGSLAAIIGCGVGTVAVVHIVDLGGRVFGGVLFGQESSIGFLALGGFLGCITCEVQITDGTLLVSLVTASQTGCIHGCSGVAEGVAVGFDRLSIGCAAAFCGTGVGHLTLGFAAGSSSLNTIVPVVILSCAVLATAVDTQVGVGCILAVAVALDRAGIGVFLLRNRKGGGICLAIGGIGCCICSEVQLTDRALPVSLVTASLAGCGLSIGNFIEVVALRINILGGSAQLSFAIGAIGYQLIRAVGETGCLDTVLFLCYLGVGSHIALRAAGTFVPVVGLIRGPLGRITVYGSCSGQSFQSSLCLVRSEVSFTNGAVVVSSNCALQFGCCVDRLCRIDQITVVVIAKLAVALATLFTDSLCNTGSSAAMAAIVCDLVAAVVAQMVFIVAVGMGAHVFVAAVVTGVILVLILVLQCINRLGIGCAAAFCGTGVGHLTLGFAAGCGSLLAIVPGMSGGITVFTTAVDTQVGVGCILAVAVALDRAGVIVSQRGNFLAAGGVAASIGARIDGFPAGLLALRLDLLGNQLHIMCPDGQSAGDIADGVVCARIRAGGGDGVAVHSTHDGIGGQGGCSSQCVATNQAVHGVGQLRPGRIHTDRIAAGSDGDSRRSDGPGLLDSAGVVAGAGNGQSVSASIGGSVAGDRAGHAGGDGVGHSLLGAGVGVIAGNGHIVSIDSLGCDGHGDGLDSHIVVIVITNDLVIHGVFTGIGCGGELDRPVLVVQAVLHHAALCGTGSDQRLGRAVVGQHICSRCGDDGISFVDGDSDGGGGAFVIVGARNSVGDSVGARFHQSGGNSVAGHIAEVAGRGGQSHSFAIGHDNRCGVHSNDSLCLADGPGLLDSAGVVAGAGNGQSVSASIGGSVAGDRAGHAGGDGVGHSLLGAGVGVIAGNGHIVAIDGLGCDGHGDGLDSHIVVVLIANDLVIHGVFTGIGCSGELGRPVLAVQAVLHLAASCGTGSDQRLGRAVVGQIGNSRGGRGNAGSCRRDGEVHGNAGSTGGQSCGVGACIHGGLGQSILTLLIGNGIGGILQLASGNSCLGIAIISQVCRSCQGQGCAVAAAVSTGLGNYQTGCGVGVGVGQLLSCKCISTVLAACSGDFCITGEVQITDGTLLVSPVTASQTGCGHGCSGVVEGVAGGLDRVAGVGVATNGACIGSVARFRTSRRGNSGFVAMLSGCSDGFLCRTYLLAADGAVNNAVIRASLAAGGLDAVFFDCIAVSVAVGGTQTVGALGGRIIHIRVVIPSVMCCTVIVFCGLSGCLCILIFGTRVTISIFQPGNIDFKLDRLLIIIIGYGMLIQSRFFNLVEEADMSGLPGGNNLCTALGGVQTCFSIQPTINIHLRITCGFNGCFVSTGTIGSPGRGISQRDKVIVGHICVKSVVSPLVRIHDVNIARGCQLSALR